MNAGVDVVVAAGSAAEPSDECMQALRREAGDGVRVVSGETRWQARQQALATSSADVIAFVDPDVVVSEGWLDSLHLAWEVSPRSVAAVGGPIRADAPEWAAGRLGLIDLGDDVLELDPASRTLFGGNLSFRRRALSGAGGFEPPVDGRDANDWLSEEHEAQRQLGHWGWLVRYEPALAAERLIPARRPLTRAYRYGVRTGIAGSRERSAALRQCLKSSAGALAALARGKRTEATERAARAAENFGVISAPARGGLPPYARVSFTSERGQTPPSWGGVSGFGGLTPPAVDVVLLYHRFAAGEADPLGLCVSPSNFEAQLRVLADGFAVVPLSEIAAGVRAGADASGRVAITIDDGYVDNLTTGIPLIVAAGLPATLFAATGHIRSGRRFFWDEMQRLLLGPGPRPVQLTIGDRQWRTRTAAEREVAYGELHRSTQPRALPEIEQVVEALRAWAGDAGGTAPEATRPVTVDELKRIAEMPGIEVGAHTRNHVNLAHQDADTLATEVAGSRDDVSEWTGAAPAGFSYPFGLPRHDVSAEARAAVAAAGFDYAVVNQPVAAEPGDDVYAIPRLFAPDAGADDFRVWLSRVVA